MDSKTIEARRKYQKDYQRKWLQNPENKEKHKQSQKKWREKNKEKLIQNSINFYTRIAKELEQ